MAEAEILPHGGLEQLADGLWRVKGVNTYPLHRTMIVVRLRSGELLLHSVVAASDGVLREIEAKGPIAYGVVPNRGHQRDTLFYQRRYPGMRWLAPAAERPHLKPEIRIDGSVEDELPARGVKVHPVPGLKIAECVYEVELRGGDRALIVNDTFSNAGSYDLSRLMGRLMSRPMGVPGNGFGLARIFRMVQVSDRSALRTFAVKLAETPDLRIITVSHGDPITDKASEALRTARL